MTKQKWPEEKWILDPDTTHNSIIRQEGWNDCLAVCTPIKDELVEALNKIINITCDGFEESAHEMKFIAKQALDKIGG